MESTLEHSCADVAGVLMLASGGRAPIICSQSAHGGPVQLQPICSISSFELATRSYPELRLVTGHLSHPCQKPPSGVLADQRPLITYAVAMPRSAAGVVVCARVLQTPRSIRRGSSMTSFNRFRNVTAYSNACV